MRWSCCGSPRGRGGRGRAPPPAPRGGGGGGGGRAAWRGEGGIDARDMARRADELRGDGGTVVMVALDGRAAGLLQVVDPLKPGAREAVRALQAEGVHVVMVTGDARGTAPAVARPPGVEEGESEGLPSQKAEVVARYRGRGRTVAMAG